MRKIKLIIGLTFLLVNTVVYGGGIVTNTNQSAAWVRMYARDASRDMDAVYYNPAGLTSLDKGLHFSLNNLSLFSTRTIKNNYPYLNSSEYKGKVSAPLFPCLYGAYSTGKFVFSFGFNPVGGGGNATYNKGLPSFELAVSDLTPSLKPFGVTGYSSNVYFKGSSVFYGYQAGVSYKINDMISVFAGGRYVHAVNKYQGSLTNNMVIVTGSPTPASDFLRSVVVPYATNGATQASGVVSSLQTQINNGYGSVPLTALPPAQSAALIQGLQAQGINPTGFTVQNARDAYASIATAATASAQNATAKATLLEDQSVDVTQSGSGFTPILGVNLSLMEDKLNIGMKYEFITKITLTNNTGKDITTGYTSTGTPVTQFPDGAKTPSDMPALLTVGASYKLFKDFKASAGFHYYFDKNANYGHSLNGLVVENDKLINSNNYELAVGFEYNLNEKILLSTGYLYTKTGVMVGYNTDLSYSLGSSSVGLGGRWTISPKYTLDLGFSYTEYEPGSKIYDHVIPTSVPQTMSLKEKYSKNVIIFAVGLNINLSKP